MSLARARNEGFWWVLGHRISREKERFGSFFHSFYCSSESFREILAACVSCLFNHCRRC